MNFTVQDPISSAQTKRNQHKHIEAYEFKLQEMKLHVIVIRIEKLIIKFHVQKHSLNLQTTKKKIVHAHKTNY